MNLLMAPTISKAKGHKLLGNQCAKGRAAKLLRIFEFVKAYFTEQLLLSYYGHDDVFTYSSLIYLKKFGGFGN